MNSPSSTVTLNDVAKAAGVSVSTASRALNGRAEEYRIRESTAQTVRQTAERLGFQPSILARSLRLKKTGLVGIVVPDLSNAFFSAIARAVTVSAESAGMAALIADSGGSTEKETLHLNALTARNVESIVICPVGIHFNHLEKVHQQGVPLVMVDRCQSESTLVQVTSEHYSGARLAIEELLAHGHQNIGILQGLPETLPCSARLNGVRDSLEAVGIPYREEFVEGSEFTEQSGYQSALKLLQENPQLTALFAMSYPNAFGAMRAIRELGLNMPKDVSLITFDDAPHADFLEVPLTAVAQDIDQIGRTAANLVMELIQVKQPLKITNHQIPVELIKRASVERVSR